MPTLINVVLEDWHPSPVVRRVRPDYRRRPATSYQDHRAALSPRQATFYRNLIRMAEATGSGVLPVDFLLPGGIHAFLDRGCIKIAEHAGFIQPLVNSPAGVVDAISLAWSVNADELHC